MLLKLLLKRNDVYYFRWQIPVDLRTILGARELVKSLRTAKKNDAILYSNYLVRAVEHIKSYRIEYMCGCMDQIEYESLIKAAWNELKEKVNARPSQDELPPDPAFCYPGEYNPSPPAVEGAVTYLDYLLEDFDKTTGKFEVAPRQAEEVIKRVFGEGSNIDNYPEGIREQLIQDVLSMEYCYLIWRLNKLGYSSYLNIYKKDEWGPKLPEVLREKRTDFKNNSDEDQQKSHIMLFSELHTNFLDHKKRYNNLKPGMESEYIRYSLAFLEIAKDRKIAEITRGGLKKFLLDVSLLPKRNLGKYKGKSCQELLNMEIPEEDRVASRYVSNVRKWVQGVFAFAVETELLKSSPATKIDPNIKRKPKDDRTKYSDDEVMRFLDCSNNLAERFVEKKWLIWIAFYTGMRLKEIWQLKKDNIKYDSNLNRYYILVTDSGQDQSIKTSSSLRRVPVSRALEQEGLIKYIKTLESDEVFPKTKKNSFSNWFGRFRESLGIDKFNEMGNKRDFHSSRHTFVTKSRSKYGNLNNIRQVTGHKFEDDGVTGVYTHESPLKELLEVVDCVAYEDD